jgi:hypothetical protein
MEKLWPSQAEWERARTRRAEENGLRRRLLDQAVREACCCHRAWTPVRLLRVMMLHASARGQVSVLAEIRERFRLLWISQP